MRVSFGLITRRLDRSCSIVEFLKNAERHNRKIHSVIVAYSDEMDPSYAKEIQKYTKLDLIRIGGECVIYDEMRHIGMSKKGIKTLLGCKSIEKSGLIPYGKNRNHVIISAMLDQVDYLIFVDTDVYPHVLVNEQGKVVKKEIDFVGRHLQYLTQDGICVTTSDYSGFYIIPPMKFDNMCTFFEGLQKGNVCEFLDGSNNHHNLTCDNWYARKVFETGKILGGNVGLELKAFEKLLPFFSSIYTVNGTDYLTRGEDTLLGLEINRSDKYIAMDIDTKIFHNTYGDYPKVPDILNNQMIKDRFFYACMGWIGRNPFMNWINGEDVESIYREQKKALIKTADAVAKYLDDDRFLVLPDALDASMKHLPKMIKQYKNMAHYWQEFVKHVRKGGVDIENINRESLSVGRFGKRHLH